MAQLNPYLTFNGQCREAMNFYQGCLGGEVDLVTIAGSPIESQMPAEMKQNILNSTLTLNGTVILRGSDMVGPTLINGNNMTLMLNCESEAEINDAFNKLSEGGQATFPVTKEFWGSLFGQLTDKYGFNWMLNCDPPASA